MKHECLLFAGLLLASCSSATPPPRNEARGNAGEPRTSAEARTVAEPAVSPRDAAVARALAAGGQRSPAVIAETLDVDGDGRPDTVFHAAAPGVCALAREVAGQWRADVLPSPFEGAPNQEVTCWAPIALPQGALLAMSAVSLVDGGPSAQAALQLFATAPGGAPAVVYTEMFPFVSTWSFRAMGDDGLELIATTVSPWTTAIPEMHKVLRRASTGNWLPASCWGDRAVDAPRTEQTCTVTLPEEGRLRRLEAETFGPPPFPGTQAVVLYPGQPAARRRGPRSWCVVPPDNEPRWIELAPALTSPCPTPSATER